MLFKLNYVEHNLKKLNDILYEIDLSLLGTLIPKKNQKIN